jgi:hypothetical protein
VDGVFLVLRWCCGWLNFAVYEPQGFLDPQVFSSVWRIGCDTFPFAFDSMDCEGGGEPKQPVAVWLYWQR